MGAVWRARHRLLARDAAIKLVKHEALGDTESAAQSQLRRFEREAQATALLQSQHSIRLFDFGVTEDGSFYYVMELLDGRDLESLVKEFGPLPPERAMYLLGQVCHSLAEAHARGMVHRDIKPANIFLCRMGLEFDFVKVLDFGLVQTRRPDRLDRGHRDTGHRAAADRDAGIHGAGSDSWPGRCRSARGRVCDRVRRVLPADGHAGVSRRQPDAGPRRSRARRAGAALEPTRAGRCRGKSTRSSSIVSARIRTTGRKMPVSCLARIASYHLGGQWSGAHAKAWWQARLPGFAAPLAPLGHRFALIRFGTDIGV